MGSSQNRYALKDQYWSVTDAVLRSDRSQLELALKADLAEPFLMVLVEVAIREGVAVDCFQVLLNDARLDLYGRHRSGKTLVSMLSFQEDRSLRDTYLGALTAAREARSKEAPLRLYEPVVITFTEVSRFLSECYGADATATSELTLEATEDWFSAPTEAQQEGGALIVVGEEPINRMRALMSYLKARLGDLAGPIGHFNQLEEGFVTGKLTGDRATCVRILARCEVIAAIASRIEEDARVQSWLSNTSEELGYCVAGVLDALENLLTANPVTLAGPLEGFYRRLSGEVDSEVVQYLHQARTKPGQRESYDERQSRHACLAAIYAQCGLVVASQADDPNYLKAIPGPLRERIAYRALAQVGGVQALVGQLVAYIKESFSGFHTTQDLSEAAACREFMEKFERLMQPLGFEDIHSLFDCNDNLSRVRLKRNDGLKQAIASVGLVKELPRSFVASKQCVIDFLQNESVEAEQRELVSLFQQPHGLSVVIAALKEVDESSVKPERLVMPLPGMGQSLLTLIASDPFQEPELLSGQRLRTPAEMYDSEDVSPIEPVEDNLQGLLGKLSEDQRSRLMHQILFTPGAMRTALLLLKADPARQAFIPAVNAFSVFNSNHLVQFEALEYSGSLMSYLYCYVYLYLGELS